MSKLTNEKRAELKSKHRRAVLWEDKEVGDVVLIPASQFVWDEFIDTASKDNAAGPTRTLVDQCVVFPPMDELQAMHRDFPGLADALAKKIRHISGGREDIQVKEL